MVRYRRILREGDKWYAQIAARAPGIDRRCRLRHGREVEVSLSHYGQSPTSEQNTDSLISRRLDPTLKVVNYPERGATPMAEVVVALRSPVRAGKADVNYVLP
jgi:hypothetical protein